MSSQTPKIDGELLELLTERYMGDPENEDEKLMGKIHQLLDRHHDKRESLGTFLTDVASFIKNQYHFKEVSIGLLDKSDNKYRYKVLIGLSDPALKARRNASYTYKEFFNSSRFPAIKICSRTEFNTLTPREEDKKTYSSPDSLDEHRSSLDIMLGGDYLCIYMYGHQKRMIGWIELSNPTDGKLPSRKAIKWLELIAAITGRLVWEKDYAR